MPSGDGRLVRVKPFGGRLAVAALQALAAAVTEYGNGVVELTGRGNLQVRGVRDAPAFARAMVAAGLADADPVREARRNVVTVPPCDDAVVAEAEAVLADTAGLPAKFCVVVSGSEVFLDGEKVASLRHTLPSMGIPRAYARGTFAHSAQPSPRGRGLFKLPLPLGESRGEGGWHLLYLPFAQTDAAALARFNTEIRTTPWRALLSPIPVTGFDTAPSTITTCPGAPACASATVPARADAAKLVAAGFTHLHVSGCAKGCAHPHAATTLVGRDGCYDLVRHGRAGDPPDQRSLLLDQAMAAL